MTPLAHKIVKELTLPLKERRFDSNFARKVAEAKCFDCTAVRDAIREFISQYTAIIDHWPISVHLLHLPAKTTWLEFPTVDGESSGLLLSARGSEFDPKFELVTVGRFKNGEFRISDPPMELSVNPPRTISVADPSRARSDTGRRLALGIMACLSMINTPRKFRQVVAHPHVGLAKRLGKELGIQGRFPLQATTKIVLWDRDLDEGVDTETCGRTFKMPLHFVRAHRKPALSARLGRDIEVESYWAGDPSLGIRNSDYELRHRSAA